uniref:Uncharacterized protein n=1 Tax=Oryza sativa subsp. japonica TaxID=39947 RepID=Q8GS75_ORYSJ|nr:hypothetical protein [Oryza sativa Japonica Group]BAD30248.1 hypothetical protein [Oryza sativa Japonica Group]
MATVFPYRWSRTEHLTLRPPCHGGDPLDAHQPLPWILLDVRAYIADRRNSTTAAADLGNGHHLYRPTAAGILHLCLVHLTNKVITLDEGQGEVAFIDLKRGINPHLQRARPWLSWKSPATAARAHQLSNELQYLIALPGHCHR